MNLLVFDWIAKLVVVFAGRSRLYSLGNGFGKLRGAKNGGLQKTLQWRNIILSTGEMPLIRESCMDGVGSRVLELYGRPIADEVRARELHQVSERHYGHAGRRYIQYLAEEALSEDGKLERLYRDMQERLRAEYGETHEGEPGVRRTSRSASMCGVRVAYGRSLLNDIRIFRRTMSRSSGCSMIL